MARSGPGNENALASGEAATIVRVTRHTLLGVLAKATPPIEEMKERSLKKGSDLQVNIILKTILAMASQYDEHAAIGACLKRLLAISYYAQLGNIQSLVKICSTELEHFKYEALDGSELVWPYLVAYRCSDWEEVSFDNPASYRVFHTKVLKASTVSVIGKSSGTSASILEKIGALIGLLHDHAKTYGTKSFNYLTLESMNNYRVAREILANLIAQFSEDKENVVKEKYYTQHWALIELVAEWASLAEVYFKGLNSEKCVAHRKSSFGRKDSDNAEKDAPRFIYALQQQPEFHESLSLLDDIYTLERLLGGFEEYKDEEWYLHLSSTLAQQLQKYIMATQLLNPYVLDYVYYLFRVLEDILLISHKLPDEQLQALSEVWQQKLSNEIDAFLDKNMTAAQLLDVQYQQAIKGIVYIRERLALLGKQKLGVKAQAQQLEVACKIERVPEFNFLQAAPITISIKQLRQLEDWLGHVNQALQHVKHGQGDQPGVQSCLSAVISGARIQRLGGISPLVYRINCRDDTWLLLRLFSTDMEEANQRAIKLLQEGAADFLGKNYLCGEAFGDYTYCECSEFFDSGSLDKYLATLDHSPQGKMSERQQRMLFQHFKQVVTVMSYLHSNNAYFPDAKPPNFLFDKDPLLHDDAKLVLSDLKSLRMFCEEDHKRKRDIMDCTPDYTAPEILESSDEVHPFAQGFYSLGVTFLEYLTGTRDKRAIEAFHPRDHFEVVMKGVLLRLVAAEPQQRVNYGNFLVDNFSQLEKRLFTPPRRAMSEALCANFGATLFTRHHFMREGSDKVLQGGQRDRIVRLNKAAVLEEIRQLYPESDHQSVFTVS